jgi:hypothetical protein
MVSVSIFNLNYVGVDLLYEVDNQTMYPHLLCL